MEHCELSTKRRGQLGSPAAKTLLFQQKLYNIGYQDGSETLEVGNVVWAYTYDGWKLTVNAPYFRMNQSLHNPLDLPSVVLAKYDHTAAKWKVFWIWQAPIDDWSAEGAAAALNWGYFPNSPEPRFKLLLLEGDYDTVGDEIAMDLDVIVSQPPDEQYWSP